MVGSLGASTYAEEIALTRDGAFAAVSFRGGVSIWETASDTLRYRLPGAGERTLMLKRPGRGYDYAEVRFSPDGTRLALVGQNEEYGSGDDWRQVARATLWELPMGRFVGSYEQNTPTHAQVDAHAWNGQSPVIDVAYGDRLELV